MKDWKQILYDIYPLKIGSICAAPNNIWTNSFASNQSNIDCHPSVIGKVSPCKTSCKIVPGTSKDYRKDSCVFRVTLDTSDPTYPPSYFLIDFWMTISKNDFLTFKSGWDGIKKLNEEQLRAFKQQIKFCKGIDV